LAVLKNCTDDSSLPKNLKIWRRFFANQASENYLRYFSQLSSLRQGQVLIFGKTHRTPRLEAFFGESGLSYTYSNQRFESLPFCEVLLEIKEAVEFTTQFNYNAVLVNYYRNGNDSNGWHADNEPELGDDPVVASLSFGASRKFYLRSNTENRTLKLLLENGDLLLMGKGMQTEWKHCVPKSPNVLEPRINLTFRKIIQS
jgi:alkylated DNA repair dioxygenase AlkB